MTCRYVRALIEALPIEELNPRERRLVNQHARCCPDCQTVLLEANLLDTGLRQLPDPEFPSGLAERIMTQTARIDKDSTVVKRSRVTARAPGKTGRRFSLGWGSIFGGAAIAFGNLVKTFTSESFTVDRVLPSPVHWDGLLKMPVPNTATLILAFGLLLYLSGVFVIQHREEKEEYQPR